jgi:Mrp family chromosome partitioning ATPase
MKRAGARILGVVLNRIPKNRSYYYGGYRYYSPYYNQYHHQTDPKRASRIHQPHRPRLTLGGFFKLFSTWRSRWKRARRKEVSATQWATTYSSGIQATVRSPDFRAQLNRIVSEQEKTTPRTS